MLSTQERFDGRGYPRGLAALEIPMSARVISLVDAFDLLTTGHPLGLRLSLPEACAELVRGAGVQFDPDLVQALAAAGRHVAPTRSHSWRVTPDARRVLRHLSQLFVDRRRCCFQQPNQKGPNGPFGWEKSISLGARGEVCAAAEAYSLGRFETRSALEFDRCC